MAETIFQNYSMLAIIVNRSLKFKSLAFSPSAPPFFWAISLNFRHIFQNAKVHLIWVRKRKSETDMKYWLNHNEVITTLFCCKINYILPKFSKPAWSFFQSRGLGKLGRQGVICWCFNQQMPYCLATLLVYMAQAFSCLWKKNFSVENKKFSSTKMEISLVLDFVNL